MKSYLKYLLRRNRSKIVVLLLVLLGTGLTYLNPFDGVDRINADIEHEQEIDLDDLSINEISHIILRGNGLAEVYLTDIIVVQAGFNTYSRNSGIQKKKKVFIHFDENDRAKVLNYCFVSTSGGLINITKVSCYTACQNECKKLQACSIVKMKGGHSIEVECSEISVIEAKCRDCGGCSTCSL